jgi:ATP-dependent Lon protease
VKEKVLAAVQAGITTVLLPARNRKDLDDVPERARKLVRFVWVERIEEALAAALSESKAASDDPSTSGEAPAPSVKRAARSR